MAATATQIKNFVGGEERDGAQYGNEPILNPATEEEIATAPKSGEEDVNAAVKAAKDAFPGWSSTTPGERALALLRLADAIEEHADARVAERGQAARAREV
jgi:betaine-aldehyde dehydrogenase